MVRIDDIEKIQHDKETAGLTPENFNKRISALIQEAKDIFAGRNIKFTSDGEIYLTEISEYSNEELEVVKQINAELKELIGRGGKMPEGHLYKETGRKDKQVIL